jgi:hypothetical protein
MIFFPISAAIAAYVFYRAFADSCLVYTNGYAPELLVVDTPAAQESR